MNSKAQAPCYREGLLPVPISANNSSEHPFRTLLPEVPRAGVPMPKQFGRWPDTARIRKNDDGDERNSGPAAVGQHERSNSLHNSGSGFPGDDTCRQETMQVQSDDTLLGPVGEPNLVKNEKEKQEIKDKDEEERYSGSASTGSTGTNEEISAARSTSLLTATSEVAQGDPSANDEASKPDVIPELNFSTSGCGSDGQPSDLSQNALLSDRASLNPSSPTNFDAQALFSDELKEDESKPSPDTGDASTEHNKYCCPNPCEWNVFFLEDCAEHRARWNLTLATLRSLLQLGPDQGWADIFEACEALCVRAGKIPLESVERDLKKVQKAESRIVQLEEQVRSQNTHINNLKELMQSVQSTLDTTAERYEAQVRKSEQYVAEINELETWCIQLQTSLTEKELQYTALRSQYEELQCQVEEQQAMVADAQVKQREQSLLIEEYESELLKKTRDMEALLADLDRAKSDCFQQEKQATEARERHLMEVNVLEVELKEKTDLIQNYSEKLLAYEASARRRLSYRSSPSLNHEDTPSAPGTSPKAISTKALSPKRFRGGGSAVFQQPGSPVAGTNTSVPTSACTSATSTPLLSYRSVAKSQVTLGSPTKSMTDEERHRFLAHFPMAMRTERQIRTHDRLMQRRASTATASTSG